MNNADLGDRFAHTTAANVADACIRLGIGIGAPAGIRPLFPAARCIGRALPVVHLGSVDAFLEAFDSAEAGDILVIDNQNRVDEACIGDLTVLEARNAGVAGIIVWGGHRDTAQLLEIGLPVFSTGVTPVGPRGLRKAIIWDFGGVKVTRDHIVVADADGVIFFEAQHATAVLDQAKAIAVRERAQAKGARAGRSLRSQFEWSAYLARRAERPGYTFREHIASLGAAIEV